jgi:hypothetical protein
MIKTKNIHLGFFFEYNFTMNIPLKEYNKIGLDEKFWQNKFQEYLESEKKGAVEKYKQDLFIKQLENYKPKWWKFW